MDDSFETERFRDFVDLAGDFAWEVDAASRFVFVAPRLAFGWPAASLIGRRVADILADAADAKRFAVTEPGSAAAVALRDGHGGTIRLDLWARPVFDSSGLWSGARGIGRESGLAPSRDAAMSQARQRDGLLRHVVRSLRDEHQPEAALSAVLATLGLAVGAAGGAVLRGQQDAPLRPAATWGARTPPAALAQLGAVLAGGSERISVIAAGAQLAAQAIRYRGQIAGALALWRRGDAGAFGAFDRDLVADAADHLGSALAQIEARERIDHLAHTDHLTGLVNRGAFFEELARRLSRLDRGAKPAALLYADVANLKLVNESGGPAGGDAALIALASILREHSRAGDLIARFGGAEFALWIEGIEPAGAHSRAASLARAAGRFASLSGSASRPFGLAVGVAIFDPARPEGLLRLIARAAAEAARAKASGDWPDSLQA